jgi:redox-sensitive bicupin YhaK (pirin superfamily)
MMTKIKKIRPLSFQWEPQNPFLFSVHHEDFYPEGNEEMGPKESTADRVTGNDFTVKNGYRMYHGERIPGFPGHPHRGFETLTVVRKGFVDHSDSAGGAGRYGAGDLQWMTAGKGLLHSEMFPLINKEQPNTLEIFQIWLNLPKENKMKEADYKMFWKEDVPHFEKNGVQVEVLAGSLFDHSSPTPPENSWAHNKENYVGVYHFEMPKNSEIIVPKTAAGINRTIYFYKGNELLVADEKIEKYHAIDVEPAEDISLKTSNSEAKILILQGRPIDEPVVQHGPFVMNTESEIQNAFAEYRATQFGGWPFDTYEKVHPREKGRFALFSDGREIVKE